MPLLHRLRIRVPWSSSAVLAAVGLIALAPSAAGDLQSRITAEKAREQKLRSSIQADRSKVQGFQGKIEDLQARETGIQASLDAERSELADLKSRLRAARGHLIVLRQRVATDRSVLAHQLVAQYESAQPDLVTVVLNAKGFAALLETVDAMKAVNHRNATITADVVAARTATATEASRLTDLTSRQQRITSAVLSQRDQVAQLKIAMVSRQMVYARAKSSKSTELASLSLKRTGLEKQLVKIQARAAAFSLPPGAPAVTGTYAGGSGSYGFFPAAGTNYSVGDEPALAAKLDTLGKALHLHLIGVSGYRTPQHSVEVGGFANDPHTHGEASDTPGVEGVPESTLNQYGLTRPFPGAAEADHIQLVGSI